MSMARSQSKLIAVLFLFSVFVLLPIASSKSTKINFCNNKANYEVKVIGVDINPSPITRGKPTTFSISASTDQPISGGKLVIDVSYWGIPIHSESHDLCSETSCPVSAGKFLVSHSQELPGYTPPGSYTLTVTMVDSDKKQLTCFNFGFSIWFAATEEAVAIADS